MTLQNKAGNARSDTATKAGRQRTFTASCSGDSTSQKVVVSLCKTYEAESNGAARKLPRGKVPGKMFVQWRVIGACGRHGGIFVSSSNIKSEA